MDSFFDHQEVAELLQYQIFFGETKLNDYFEHFTSYQHPEQARFICLRRYQPTQIRLYRYNFIEGLSVNIYHISSSRLSGEVLSLSMYIFSEHTKRQQVA